MIKRIWHGWTRPGDADRYEALLKGEIFPGIAAKNIPGYRGVELYRRADGDEVEFVTVMEFESLSAVRAFAGEDYEACYVPASGKKVLARFDQRSKHYAVRTTAGR